MIVWKLTLEYIERGDWGREYTVTTPCVGLATSAEVACRQAMRVAKREGLKSPHLTGVEKIGVREF